MGRFRCVEVVIWNDERFRGFSDDGKLAFLFLLTHPAMTALGATRATIDGLAAELQWSGRRLRAALRPAVQHGMVVVDEGASFLRLRHFLRYNAPKNPNQVRAWRSAAELIPECQLKVDLLSDAFDVVSELGESFREAFVEQFGERFRKRSGDSSPIQEQDQEQEKDQEQQQDYSASTKRPDELAPGNGTTSAKRVFHTGVRLLTAAGLAEQPARSLIGKLRKLHGDEEAVRLVTEAEGKTDPRAWLAATMVDPSEQPYVPMGRR
jgi:hypothetical protein